MTKTLLARTQEFVWNEGFWLPTGSSWKTLDQYNKFSIDYHVLYPIYTGIALYIIRIIFEA
jgi:hypothetical protein